MNRRLQYISLGRAGKVVYQDAISAISFDYEFGGGNCIAIIFIPSAENWTSATNRPIADRNDVLNYVAGKATSDQVSDGYFVISERFIEIFKKKL